MIQLFLQALLIFINIITILIIASALLSWFPTPALNKIRKTLHHLLEPILAPIRRMIQKSIFGGSHMTIDFSPFIAYLILNTLQRYIAVYLVNL